MTNVIFHFKDGHSEAFDGVISIVHEVVSGRVAIRYYNPSSSITVQSWLLKDIDSIHYGRA